jgi:integral membrane sensor domain MASE1
MYAYPSLRRGSRLNSSSSLDATGPRSPRWSSPVAVVSVGVVYVAAAKIGLLFAAISPSATAVWPPTGIALAACLLVGYRVWPAILAGAFLANVTTAGSVATSLGIAVGNTLEALVGAYCVTRWARGASVFETARDIFAFVALAAMGSTTVSATIGVTSLALGGYAGWGRLRPHLAHVVARRCHGHAHLRAAAGPLGAGSLAPLVA